VILSSNFPTRVKVLFSIDISSRQSVQFYPING